MVVGEVIQVVNEDVYIDIGFKFPVVANLSSKSEHHPIYKKGSKVRVMIKRLECSELFLGFEKELSVLEAEGVLLGKHKMGTEVPRPAPASI